MRLKKLPPLSLLRELFECDAVRGVLTRKKSIGASRIGASVGTPNGFGYLIVVVSYKHYMAHRIVWAMSHGEDPFPAVIDHINGITSDNRIANLRLATHAMNSLNTKLSKRNKTGEKGVYYDRSKGMWRASIANKFIGRYRTKEEAARAYRDAALQRGGSFARFE